MQASASMAGAMPAFCGHYMAARLFAGATIIFWPGRFLPPPFAKYARLGRASICMSASCALRLFVIGRADIFRHSSNSSRPARHRRRFFSRSYGHRAIASAAFHGARCRASYFARRISDRNFSAWRIERMRCVTLLQHRLAWLLRLDIHGVVMTRLAISTVDENALRRAAVEAARVHLRRWRDQDYRYGVAWHQHISLMSAK